MNKHQQKSKARQNSLNISGSKTGQSIVDATEVAHLIKNIFTLNQYLQEIIIH